MALTVLETQHPPALQAADSAQAQHPANSKPTGHNLFADLHAEREKLDAQLAALAAATPRAADPTLLDQLPLAEDVLPGLPSALKARLLDAFDIQILWNKPGRQATVHAEITDVTLRALPAILNPGQDDYDDTSEQISENLCDREDLFEALMVDRIDHGARIHHDNRAGSPLDLPMRGTRDNRDARGWQGCTGYLTR